MRDSTADHARDRLLTVEYSAASLDTSTVESSAEQLGLPALPGLEVNALQTTLEGS